MHKAVSGSSDSSPTEGALRAYQLNEGEHAVECAA